MKFTLGHQALFATFGLIETFVRHARPRNRPNGARQGHRSFSPSRTAALAGLTALVIVAGNWTTTESNWHLSDNTLAAIDGLQIQLRLWDVEIEANLRTVG